MKSVRAGRAFGIDVFVDPSLFVLVAFLTWAIFVRFEDLYPTVGGRWLLLIGAAGGVLFLLSVLAHEVGHSLVAVRRGFTVRRIRLFIFGGVSEIEQEATTPADEFLVAIAGPAASIAVGGVMVAVAWPLAGPMAAMVGLVGAMNLLLAAFNLLPGLPLDGGRLLRAVMWKWRGDRWMATRTAVVAGRVLGIVLIVGGLLLVVGVGDLTGLWIVAVGWFLERAAASSLVRERLVERAGDATLRDTMRPVQVAADGSMTVAEVLERHGWGTRLRTIPVVVAGRVRGVVGDREIARVGAEGLTTMSVESVMTPIGQRDVADAEEPLLEFLGRAASPARRVLITEENRVVGIITGEELAFLFE
jgi:Zn-dependent protease